MSTEQNFCEIESTTSGFGAIRIHIEPALQVGLPDQVLSLVGRSVNCRQKRRGCGFSLPVAGEPSKLDLLVQTIESARAISWRETLVCAWRMVCGVKYQRSGLGPCRLRDFSRSCRRGSCAENQV